MSKKNLPSQNVDEIIREITFVWNKAAEYIIEVSQLLYKYQSDDENKGLWNEIRSELIKRKIMSKTQIYTLSKIGSNQVLPIFVDKLPPSYNTIYQLALLPYEDLTYGFEKNLITPELRLEDINGWKKYGLTIDNETGDFENLEISQSISGLKRSVTIFFDEDEIINNYDYIQKQIEELKKKLKKSHIEVSGLLKRKIEGD